MQPSELNLYHIDEQLRLTVADDRTYFVVKPVWSAPLSRPNEFLVLLDARGEEIVMIENPGRDLPAGSWQAVERELHHRYLTATVTAIRDARQEYGATYWTVETNRGEREFVTQSLQENAQWISEHHLLLIDVDGNRFEIPDTTALDGRSRAFIHVIL